MTRTWDLDCGQGAAERPRTWVLVGGLALVVAGVHLVTGWHSEGPVVFGDEGGYLRIARHLAGEGPVATTKYFPGYSLLIAPVHWALGSTGAIFNGVKVLNAALGGVTAVFAYLASGYLLPRGDRWKRLGVTALVSLYPSYLLFSNQAFSENPLVPVSMLVAYAVARLVADRPGWLPAAGLGGLAAFAVVVHPRAIVVPAALAFVVGVWWWPWRRHRRCLLALASGVAVVAVAGLALVLWERSGAGPGAATYQVDRIVEKRLGLEGLRTVLVGMAGQILYLLVTTAGLAVLAGLEFARATRRAWVEGDRSPATALVVYAGLTSIVVLGMSAWFISPAPDSGRPDAILYGRYNEGLVAPIMLIGAAVLVSGRFRVWDPTRWWRGAVPLAIGLIVATGAVVELWQAGQLFESPVNNPFNILAIYPVVVFFGRVDPAIFAVLGIVGAGVFLVLGRRRPAVAVMLGVTAFLAVALRMAFFHLPDAHYEVRAEQRRVAVAANQVVEERGLECVAVDRFESAIYHFQLYRWYVDEADLEEFSSDQSDVPCSPAVITSRRDLDADYPGAQLIEREGGEIDVFLWLLPGRVPA